MHGAVSRQGTLHSVALTAALPRRATEAAMAFDGVEGPESALGLTGQPYGRSGAME